MSSRFSNQLPQRLTAGSFGALRALIRKERVKSGAKHKNWRIEEITDSKGESLRFNYYFEKIVEDDDEAMVQLDMSEVENAD